MQSSQKMLEKLKLCSTHDSKLENAYVIPPTDSSASEKENRLKFYKTVNKFYDDLPNKNFHYSELDKLLGDFQQKLIGSIGNESAWNKVITNHRHLLKWIDSAEMAVHYAEKLVNGRDYIIDVNSALILINKQTNRLHHARYSEGVHELLEARLVITPVPTKVINPEVSLATTTKLAL